MAFGKKSDLPLNVNHFSVPDEWIFEKFLNLPEVLTGQSVSIRSVFNPNDTNPSLIVYYCTKNDGYRFKDFSSGHHGNAFNLVQYLYDISLPEALRKIQDLYENNDDYLLDNRVVIPIVKEIKNYKVRSWNLTDKDYWTQYYIGSKELEEHNIKPLASYELVVTKGTEVKIKSFELACSYGYFTKDGELYKIYNPKNSVGKFLKIKDYDQGCNQLSENNQWLIIMASMKDLIAFKQLSFPNIDCIAPHSENTILSEEAMKHYQSKYKLVTILFDNDTAGKNAALKYKELYGIHHTEFDVEKDVAECVRQHGIENTKMFLKPLLLKTKDEARRKNN